MNGQEIGSLLIRIGEVLAFLVAVGVVSYYFWKHKEKKENKT